MLNSSFLEADFNARQNCLYTGTSILVISDEFLFLYIKLINTNTCFYSDVWTIYFSRFLSGFHISYLHFSSSFR